MARTIVTRAKRPRNAIVQFSVENELKRHDELMQLILVVGSVIEILHNNQLSKPMKMLLSDRQCIQQIKILDLSVCTSFLEAHDADLNKKGIIVRGVSALLYTQCTLLLEDSQLVFKKALSIEFPSAGAKCIPKTRVRGKRIATVKSGKEIDPDGTESWDSVKRQNITDGKHRLQIVDTNTKTPTANNALMQNKIIMGVGIYSQYLFDEDNNLCNHLTKIYKWNKLDDMDHLGYNIKNGMEGDEKKDVPAQERKHYLDGLTPSTDVSNEVIRLKKVSKSVLACFDEEIESPHFFDSKSRPKQPYNRQSSQRTLSLHTHLHPTPWEVVNHKSKSLPNGSEANENGKEPGGWSLDGLSFYTKRIFDSYLQGAISTQEKDNSPVKKPKNGKKRKITKPEKSHVKIVKAFEPLNKSRVTTRSKTEKGGALGQLLTFSRNIGASTFSFQQFMSPNFYDKRQVCSVFIALVNLASQGVVGLEMVNGALVITVMG